jgi:uncharacterized protein (DUF111 family)
VKCGPNRRKPEYDDLVRAARATGLPLHVLAERALVAASNHEDQWSPNR